MAYISLCWIVAFLKLSVQTVVAQSVVASNGFDIGPPAIYPRFTVDFLRASNISSFEIAPLGPYAVLTREEFAAKLFSGPLVATTPFNVNQATPNDISYVSCGPADYQNSNIDALDVVRNLIRLDTSIILYSTSTSHCFINNISTLPGTSGGIFTTTDPQVAAQVATLDLSRDANVNVTIRPNTTSFPNGNGYGNSSYNPSPTTAVAMIILYSITGIITALFVVIIVTGAIRAHRHPERYGPRNIVGRGRQSRAKGIARAMLETLPIVKFGDNTGDKKNSDSTADNQDTEMQPAPAATGNDNNTATNKTTETSDKINVRTSAAAAPVIASSSSSTPPSTFVPVAGGNADGTDESGLLGCSICTEDFQKGEELRVLPCNHKFHPECVDPWLLNVSGTCPLCRIDLRPNKERRSSTAASDGPEDAPPLIDGSSGNTAYGSRRMAILRAALGGSRDDRIAALRRFRAERNRMSRFDPQIPADTISSSGVAESSATPISPQGEVTDEAIGPQQQRGLAARLRERFRVGTRRHDTTEVQTSNPATSSSTSQVA